MRHRMKKLKLGYGRDSTRMLSRQLLRNFFLHGKMETTLSKARVLKTFVEQAVMKTKINSEANKNVLLKMLEDKRLVKNLFANVGSALKDKNGGYVRVIKLGQRESDGAPMARLVWAYPVVLEPELVVKSTSSKASGDKPKAKVEKAKNSKPKSK